jgi:diaminohydroxyphosphoribosylaminopyrimidine deaminase/5-amino-6-(5-phosphoribosylamino)uracil reductase
MLLIFGALAHLDGNEKYMHRCLQLARLGQGSVAPNPMVGAVLVYEDRIIGEGFHQLYGGPHAEVVCFNSVEEDDIPLINKSVLYVSLEPCAHHGKTPPCTDLIIEKGVRKVVVGCTDPFEQVGGKGIEKLRRAGVEVITPVLERDCQGLNKRFFTFHIHKRPYIILKWAQTGDGKIASKRDKRLHITNEYTNRIVHKWRSEEQSILIGTNTALLDDPQLTTRLCPGKNPVRLVVDINLRLPAHLKIFDRSAQTIVFNGERNETANNLQYYKIDRERPLVPEILIALHLLQLGSVLVEGGAQLLQSFIDADGWDEARLITNQAMIIGEGVSAPQLKGHSFITSEQQGSDSIQYHKNISNQLTYH